MEKQVKINKQSSLIECYFLTVITMIRQWCASTGEGICVPTMILIIVDTKLQIPAGIIPFVDLAA
uniref:Uncharacterized protein n=1 Tax=Lepeophtheirus salmonis TaxID=72036 RepID=A0A0K2VIV8_LEPSM